jgi:branched-chain amino acid transport system permease protein
MLAYPLAMLYVFEWLGFQELTLPIKRDAPLAYMQFSDPRLYTLVALAMLLAVVLITRAVERSRFGMALLAIKQNEAAAEAAGIDALAWKLRSIVLSGAIAGAVGAFYAVVLLVVTPPSVFGMLVSAQALTVAMFGGVGTVWGPLIGAAVLIPVGEILNAELGARIPGIQGVIYGLAIIVVILVAPEGVFWTLRDRLRRGARTAAAMTPDLSAPAAPRAPADARPASQPRKPPSGEILLSVKGLSKSFRGLKAVQDVSFDVRRGMILGIIGPNGAGKTTLFNLLNGFLPPSSGEVVFDGRNMVGCRPHVLCKAGVGRTFQIMRPFPRMSVRDNVPVGAYVQAANEQGASSRRRRREARGSQFGRRQDGGRTHHQGAAPDGDRPSAGGQTSPASARRNPGGSRPRRGRRGDRHRSTAGAGRHDGRDHRAHHAVDGAPRRPVPRA